MRFLFVCVLILFSYSPAGFAQEYKSEIANAELLGRMVYEHDVAGWVATDELLRNKTYVEAIKPSLKGWVSLKEGKNYRTVFIGDFDGTPKAIFEVTSKKHKIKESEKLQDGRTLTPQERARWQAREKIIGEKFEHCPQFTPMNTIVFPVPNDPENRMYSYLFSATQKSGVIVFGKHYRFTLTEDGSQVLDKHDFSKSCIGIDKPASAQAVGAVISHVMRPYPEEHHVFANLAQQLDIYVTIPETKQLWKVSKGSISKVKQ